MLSKNLKSHCLHKTKQSKKESGYQSNNPTLTNTKLQLWQVPLRDLWGHEILSNQSGARFRHLGQGKFPWGSDSSAGVLWHALIKRRCAKRLFLLGWGTKREGWRSCSNPVSHAHIGSSKQNGPDNSSEVRPGFHLGSPAYYLCCLGPVMKTKPQFTIWRWE